MKRYKVTVIDNRKVEIYLSAKDEEEAKNEIYETCFAKVLEKYPHKTIEADWDIDEVVEE